MPELSPEQATALKTWFAREDIAPDLKEQAKARLREHVGAAPLDPNAQPPPAPTPAAGQGSLQTTPTRGVIRGMFPEGGALGFIGDVVTNPTEVGGTIGAMAGGAGGLALGAALAPETLGASLILPALGAMGGGWLGREAGASVESPAPGGALVAPGQGRTRSPTERWIGAAVDALPIVVGNWLKPKIMTGPEVEAAAKALGLGKAAGEKGAKRLATGAKEMAEERLAALGPEPIAPANAPLAKPGRAPKPPGAIPTPEVASGVPAGAMTPLRPPPIEPTLGLEFTEVAQKHLQSTLKRKTALYTAEVDKATALGLEMPTPQEVVRGAGDALAALDRSGLDPELRDGASTVLKSIRDVEHGKVKIDKKTGEVLEVTKEPVDTVTYADLDAWRQKLQDYATPFGKLGQAQSMSKGSVGHVLGLIDESMGRLARGTEVESLHRTADDFFRAEVQPARALARTVLKGEVEPNKLVDALTGPAHEMKFARYMKQLDREAPGQAVAFRQVKLQNMIDKATKGDIFDPDDFLRQFDPDKMPVRTRNALLGGTNARELRELMTNIEQAKALARTSQADAQAAADAAHADALATHEAAAVDYTRRIAEGKAQATEQAAAYRTAREHAKAQDPVLVSARRKLASQQMLLEAPANVLGGVLGLKAVMQTGNVYPLLNFLGGGGGAYASHQLLSTILSTPNAPRVLNHLFRAAASGASERVKARLGAQLVAHLIEGTGREVLAR